MNPYCQMTLTSGFDESFNAITGLNGSGKSNILDAICFVLGITNMQSVSCCAVGEGDAGSLTPRSAQTISWT